MIAFATAPFPRPPNILTLTLQFLDGAPAQFETAPLNPSAEKSCLSKSRDPVILERPLIPDLTSSIAPVTDLARSAALCTVLYSEFSAVVNGSPARAAALFADSTIDDT